MSNIFNHTANISITLEYLETLLGSDERTWLEFKGEMYEIFGSNKVAVDRNKCEMARDIISLLNRHPSAVGKTAYLIIGVSNDLFDETGRRVVLGTSIVTPGQREEIVDKLNPYIKPYLSDLYIQNITTTEGKNVVVIILPPDPSVYETRQNLQTSEHGVYSQSVVFYRSGQGIKIASTEEHEQLQKAKYKHQKNKERITSKLPGMIIGGYAGGALLERMAEFVNVPRCIGLIVGFVVFGFFGFGMTSIMENLYLLYEKEDTSVATKLIIICVAVLILVLLTYFLVV